MEMRPLMSAASNLSFNWICDVALHLSFLRDLRFAAHATSATPAWLWSIDGTRILWANPNGAAIFSAPTSAAIAARHFEARDQAAQQIAQLAVTLPHGGIPRLQKLRGFGNSFSRMLLAACSRVALDENTSGILVVGQEAAGPTLSLGERVRRLLDGANDAIAAFAADGSLLYASGAATQRLGDPVTLSVLSADALAGEALTTGRAEGDTAFGSASIVRLGSEATSVLLITLDAEAAPTTAMPTIAPARESVALSEPVTTAPAAISDPSLPQTIDAPIPERRYPLRFVWQMDADSRFTLGSDEFIEVIGPRTAIAFGRPWQDIAAEFCLDPTGQITRAVATRDTWSGITITWPVDGTSERLAVELSGLPVYDRNRSFLGYRGFGVCRDVANIAALIQMRRSANASAPTAVAIGDQAATVASSPARREIAAPEPVRASLTIVPTAKNIVPFRNPAAPVEQKTPGLSAVERTAFRELGRELSARLNGPNDDAEPLNAAASNDDGAAVADRSANAATQVLPPDTRPLLDRLPVGVLVYRLDHLLYANRTFLEWTGYANLDALQAAGGLDSLFIEPGIETLPQADSPARLIAISTRRGDKVAVEGRLFSIPWGGETALALMLVNTAADDRLKTAESALKAVQVENRELAAMLDATSDGAIVIDGDGRILTSNLAAQTLFGSDGNDLTGQSFAGLFTPESQRVAQELLSRLARNGMSSVEDGGEVVGRMRQGRVIPLFISMGRLADGGGKFCAVFRDITAWKKAENELINARRRAEKASLAKSEFLAKISHELRTPLNSIIGFSEVMMDERFGPIANERYRQYLKDIHASGGHVVSLIDDLLDLSKIEAGKLDLTFVSVNLNAEVQQCVALMQPQASEQRIIIRTALSPAVSPVIADARSVRQIVLNLLSNSIKFTSAGGQVIISTALTDSGEVVLRVRDTGIGMSERDLVTALEPFRQVATSVRADATGAGLGLPLTKALTEANRASFAIKSKIDDGTLVEIAFPAMRTSA